MTERVDAIMATLKPLELDNEPLPDVQLVEGHGYEGVSAGVVTAARALDIAQHPDTYRIYAFEDHRALIATRRVDAGRRPFVSFAFASFRDGAWRVTAAYRLRVDDEAERAALASDPARAFATFLDRYGLDYRAGGRVVRFVPVASVEIDVNRLAVDPSALFRALDVEEPPDHQGLLHMALRVRGPGQPAKLAWPFAVASGAYARAER